MGLYLHRIRMLISGDGCIQKVVEEANEISSAATLSEKALQTKHVSAVAKISRYYYYYVLCLQTMSNRNSKDQLEPC